MNVQDVIIIGGGPAGIMAALSARKNHPDYTILILDRTHEIGRKFLTSGAGRGNLTNMNLANGPGNHFHGDQAFISSVFSQYGYKEMMAFFEELGVVTYVEKKTNKGKIFPSIDHAKTVRDMFIDVLKEQKIEIVCNATVSKIVQINEVWSVVSNAGEYLGKHLILSTGGKTYPALGSDGTGYEMARSIGHTIIEPVPSAVAVVSKNILSHFLQGEKTEMNAEAYIDGKLFSSAVGDVMFTQYGFSGPAIFDISRAFSIRINREKVSGCIVRLSFFPGKNAAEVQALLEARWIKHPSYIVANSLWGILTAKAAGGICAAAGLPKDRIASELTPEEKAKLLTVLTAFESEVTGTRGWNEAEFTAGGVDTKDIDPSTMKSKLVQNLSIVGEILNVDGDVGGFNLSWGWATGWIAGNSI